MRTAAFDFANILFAGPCNRFCPWCIGKFLPDRVNVTNLDLFPPKNIEAFIHAVNDHRISQIVFTGTVTDPQLYRFEGELLAFLRKRLRHGTEFSVHTNGVLALRKLDVFNCYDKACISFPSFEPETYSKLMGSRMVPDLAQIVRSARIPIKVSCVINEHNVGEIDGFILRCAEIGVTRVVLRKLYGGRREWKILQDQVPVRFYRRNPVYEIGGMEITYWDFDLSKSTSINLFPDGTLGDSYLLTQTEQFQSTPEDRV